MPSIYFSHKRCTLIILLLSLILSACSDSQPSTDLRGKRQSQNDFVVGSEQTSDQSYATLTGRAVKGIVQYAQVSAYSVQSGQPANEAMASVVSDGGGEFSIHLPRWKFRQLAYLEISSAPSSQSPSTMVCDAYSGCGSRNGLTVRYGDSFPLSPGVLMRNVAMLKSGANTFVGHFSPMRHAAVARAEVKTKGLTWSNVKEAESELSELFLLTKPLRELQPVNLLSIAETEAASDEQLVLAILESAYLNIGVSPNYVAVEDVLSRVTNLQGQFQSHVSADFNRLSLHNLLRAAYYNIPGYVAHRVGVTSHIQRIIQARTPDLEDELGLSQAKDTTSDGFKLQVLSNGGGGVKVLPLDALCSMSCEYLSAEGASFSLSPVPDKGYEFSHWEADCDDATDSCDLLMDGSKTASAVFKSSQQDATLYSLTLNISGAGQVVEQNSSSLCSGEGCNALLEQGQQVMLVASANDGYQFDGWSGDCSGTGSCGLSMDGNKVVTAHFSPILVKLTLELSGAGGVSSTSGLSCSSSPCQFSLPLGETVNLVANPSSGFQFDNWSGACSGKSACAVTMDSNKRVVANFSPIMHQVTLTSSSGGLIANGDQSVMCSESTCVFNFAEGSSLDLKTLAKNGYQFENWAGACSGTGACSLEIKQDMAVYANFSPILHTLSVSVSEGGSVTSLAADLNCSAGVCSTPVQEGKKITLSALSSDGYDFGSWSGQCAGSSADCSIVVESDVALSVSFKPTPVTTQAGSISVTWSAPSQREDGSSLPSGDIQSYTIYYSQTSGVYSDAITVAKMDGASVPTSATLQSLEKGSTYYIAGITVDTNGVSSQLSNEIVKTAN